MPAPLATDRRRSAARVAAAVAVLSFVAGVSATVGRSLPGFPGLAGDTWAMITTFSDFGTLAYAVSGLGWVTAMLLRFRVGQFAALVATVVLTAWHLSWIVPGYVADRDEVAGPGQLRVLSENLFFGGASPARVVARATATADVLVVVEMTRPAARAFTALGIEDRFGYQSGGPLPESGPAGTDLGLVTVVAVHPTRPVLGGSRWRPEQERLQGLIPRQRTVVAGD